MWYDDLVPQDKGGGGEHKDEKRVMVGSKFISGSGSPDGWLCSAGSKSTASTSAGIAIWGIACGTPRRHEEFKVADRRRKS